MFFFNTFSSFVFFKFSKGGKKLVFATFEKSFKKFPPKQGFLILPKFFEKNKHFDDFSEKIQKDVQKPLLSGPEIGRKKY